MSDGRERRIITSLCLHCGGEFDSYQACPRCQPIWLEPGGNAIAIADLAERVHELAAVRWDADIVPHELPMEPRPRLYLSHFANRAVIVFGGTAGRWVAIAVWMSGFDPFDHDQWDVRRPLIARGLGNDRLAEHADTDTYYKMKAAFDQEAHNARQRAEAVARGERNATQVSVDGIAGPETERYVYEGPNGTPRPAKDFSPNTRLKASLGDLLKVK